MRAHLRVIGGVAASERATSRRAAVPKLKDRFEEFQTPPVISRAAAIGGPAAVRWFRTRTESRQLGDAPRK